MKCPSCGSEIDGPNFPSHYQMCSTGAAGSDMRSRRHHSEYIDAKPADLRARARSQGMPLRGAMATRSALLAASDGQLFYQVEEWTFTYANSDEECVSVSVTATNVCDQDASRGLAVPTSEHPPIIDWRIDSGEACALAERYGAHLQAGGGPFGGGGLFQLRTANVDGVVVPLWLVPHRIIGRPIFVRADTGSAVFMKDF